MKRTTLVRFCKEHNLPKEEVCLEALKVILGYEKDVLRNHNDLKKFYLVRDASKGANIPLTKLLRVLGSLGDAPEEVKSWIEGV